MEQIAPKGVNCIFSSPEHNMLRMSYCDPSLSGVHPFAWVKVFRTMTESVFCKVAGVIFLNRINPLRKLGGGGGGGAGG